MHVRVGMPVDSAEGHWGELDDVVVDPTNWSVTHLVVQPHRHHDRSHLVAVGDVGSCDDRLTLTLSAAEIDKTPKVEVTEFIKIDPPRFFGNGWSSDANRVSAWPYYPFLGSGFVLVGSGGAGFTSGYSSVGGGPRYVATTFDHVPDKEVEVRRSSQVVSSDEHTVGTVDGFVFDDAGAITHLVLDHGHLWGHRDVTIPIGHVRRADVEQVQLDVTRDAIGEFPSVNFHRHERVT